MDKKQEEKNEEIQEEIAEEQENIHADCEQKLTIAEDKYKRALADYQNLVRRTQEQKIEWARSSNKELLLKLLPVLDTLMLAQKHIQDKGLEISINQFLRLLEDEGVTKIKTIGEEYTPHIMEAVGTTKGENNKVIDEARAGFMIHDSVLRSAQVIVGKEE